MSELPTQFMSAEPASSESASEQVLDPQLMQARLRVQTIERFQVFYDQIERISDLQERETAQQKLDALGTKEYGKAWEVLKQFEVEVFPMMIGGKTSEELIEDLRAKGCKITITAKMLMDAADFTTRSHPEPVVLVTVRPSNLGFATAPDTDQLFDRVRELGLELCPAEVGPQYCLQAATILGKVLVGMQKISIGGETDILAVEQQGRDRRVTYKILEPNTQWSPWHPILFRLPAKAAAQTGVTHE